jgi:hypothetical protein
MGAELNKALAAFQAKIPKLDKRLTADMGTFKNQYAPLEDVTAAVMPRLGEHGLSVSMRPTLNDDGKFVLAYMLKHASGEEESGEYPLPDRGTSQQLGSALTYARRYILCAITGVAPGGEDDDGAAAQQEAHMDRPAAPAKTAAPRPPQAHGADMWDEIRSEERPGSADPGDLQAIKRAYHKLGFDLSADALRMLHVSEQLAGRALSGPHKGKTHKNLTWPEAKKLRGELEGFKGDRGKLMERLTGVTQAVAAGGAQDDAEGSQDEEGKVAGE